MVLGAVALLFFLTTSIFVPISRDNKKQYTEYAQLKKEVGAIAKYTDTQMKEAEKSLDDAIAVVGKMFLPEKDTQLTKQLAQVPPTSKMVFSNISYRKSYLSSDGSYEAFPVDISATASFSDLISYLSGIEANDLIIGIESMNLRKASPVSTSLEVRLSLVGFRLIQKPLPFSNYLEEQYKPLDEDRLKKLTEPIEKGNGIVALALENFDPFSSAYDLRRAEELASKPEDATGAEPIPQDSDISDFVLKGVLQLGDKKVALINDSILEVGEKLAGVQVVDIEDYSVVLKYGEKTYTLTMGLNNESIQ